MKNRRILLASRPEGWPTAANFRLEETPLPQPAEGQFLVRNHWLSLDPYMRGRMDAAKSYAKYVELGEVMTGGTVGEVVESRHAGFKVGDFVNGTLGWQEYAVTDGTGVRKVDALAGAALVLPRRARHAGRHRLGRPARHRAAEGGRDGRRVGRVGRGRQRRRADREDQGLPGGRVSPAGRRSAATSSTELGFDACVDYRAGRLDEDLQAAAPKGIDVVFENVGGEVLDAVLRLLNAFARITICGLISQYNATEPYGISNLRSVLTNRVRMQGFIVSDRMELWPRALADLGQWVADGKIKYRETVAHGLERAAPAFLGMLRGENLGKQLVKLT